MTYLVLKNNPYKEKVDFLIKGAVLDREENIVPNIFNTGQSLNGNSFTVKLFEQYSKIGKLRDKLYVNVNNATDLFVVSPKVVKLFKSFNIDNVEFIDIEIIGKEVTISDYKLVNFLGKVDCVDDENSEIGYYTDSAPTYIYSIEWLAIDEGIIPPELSAFLIDRTDNLIIIVRQDLVEEIQKMDLSGFVFIEPENFSIG